MQNQALVSGGGRGNLGALALAAVALGAAGSAACADAILFFDPRGTYLHTGAVDPSQPAVPVSLASLGIFPGDRITLRQLGEFDNGPGTDVFTGMIAVFSSSPELLGPQLLNRVPGAIDAGVDYNSGPTCPAGEPANIAEDFAVSLPGQQIVEVCVVVPSGATHLFLSALDCYFGDNTDSDGDWGVEIRLDRGCVSDLNGDGATNGADLGVLLASWGPVAPVGSGGDLNCDGVVDGADLGALLAAWGPCGR